MTTDERIAQIKERLAAISTKVSVTIEAGNSTLRATADAPGPGEYDRFTNSFIEFVETAAEVTLEDRNVVIADDEDGQDLTFHLHAREDVPWLLEQLAEANAKADRWASGRECTVTDRCILVVGHTRECRVSVRASEMQELTADRDQALTGEHKWYSTSHRYAAERDQLAAKVQQIRQIPELPVDQFDADLYRGQARGHNAVLHDIRAILDGKEADV